MWFVGRGESPHLPLMECLSLTHKHTNTQTHKHTLNEATAVCVFDSSSYYLPMTRLPPLSLSLSLSLSLPLSLSPSLSLSLSLPLSSLSPSLSLSLSLSLPLSLSLSLSLSLCLPPSLSLSSSSAPLFLSRVITGLPSLSSSHLALDILSKHTFISPAPVIKNQPVKQL